MKSNNDLNRYKLCSKCVMDTIGNNEIRFDDLGVCNYCYEYEEKKKTRLSTPEIREYDLNTILRKIKKTESSNKYDCIIGVSGGVDSTYTAYLVKKLGLRPLAVHFDNGWNSELSVHNIQKTLDTLDIDLYTYVVDWEEFRDLQIAFLKSSTPDGEIPSDHAITATLYMIASKFGIKHIISGNNFKYEGVMPRLWAYGHIDWKYIKSIKKKFGKKKQKSYPYLTIKKFIWYTIIKKIKMISILNYIDYDKSEAMKILTDKLGWEYYGGKHYESNYTKYYQGVILPKKFGIDKRKLHYSASILSSQISREDALKELKKEIYPEEQLKIDTEYVINKLNLSKESFDNIMKLKPKVFLNYPNNYRLHLFLKKILKFLRNKKLYYN